MSEVAVLSPSRFSLYTICVAELLARRGVKLSAIYVRRLLNPRRVVDEYRRDGSRLLRKVLRKLVLRRRAYRAAPYQTIADLMKTEHITHRTVGDLGRRRGIPVIACSDLNDAAVVEGLRRTGPELVVFTGGGLLRRDLLAAAGKGVLNCHMGVLPRYRGMDVIPWPILEGEPGEVGLTVHYMDEGLDTGDLLAQRRIPPRRGESIRQVYDRFEPIMVRDLVQACLDVLEGRAQRRPQALAAGRQYFVMHPRLMAIAERKLQAGPGDAAAPAPP